MPGCPISPAFFAREVGFFTGPDFVPRSSFSRPSDIPTPPPWGSNRIIDLGENRQEIYMLRRILRHFFVVSLKY